LLDIGIVIGVDSLKIDENHIWERAKSQEGSFGKSYGRMVVVLFL